MLEAGNLTKKIFPHFVKKMVLVIIFLHLELHNKNGVVERKNRSLQEMAKTLLIDFSLPQYFWAEATSTSCYVINCVVIRNKLNKTPYEL